MEIVLLSLPLKNLWVQIFIEYLFLNMLFPLSGTHSFSPSSFISAPSLQPNSIHSSGFSLIYHIYWTLGRKRFALNNSFSPNENRAKLLYPVHRPGNRVVHWLPEDTWISAVSLGYRLVCVFPGTKALPIPTPRSSNLWFSPGRTLVTELWNASSHVSSMRQFLEACDPPGFITSSGHLKRT